MFLVSNSHECLDEITYIHAPYSRWYTLHIDFELSRTIQEAEVAIRLFAERGVI